MAKQVTADSEPSYEPNTIEILTGIYQREGKLTPEIVLDVARDPSSPLHDRFEWDDAVAAHEYRKVQASAMVRLTLTVIAETKTRAFVHVKSTSSYHPTGVAMRNPDWREEVLRDFKRDADRFRARWSTNKHIARVYEEWIADQAKK